MKNYMLQVFNNFIDNLYKWIFGAASVAYLIFHFDRNLSWIYGKHFQNCFNLYKLFDNFLTNYFCRFLKIQFKKKIVSLFVHKIDFSSVMMYVLCLFEKAAKNNSKSLQIIYVFNGESFIILAANWNKNKNWMEFIENGAETSILT